MTTTRLDAALARRAAWLPYAALLVGPVCIAWAAVFVRWAGVPGASSAFYRLAIAAAVLLPWQARRLREPLRSARRACVLAAVAGAFFALDLAFWNSGLLFTTAANATLLANTAPVWVGVGTLLLFRERLRGWFWAGMALALAGATLILGGDLIHPSAAVMAAHPQAPLGDALALIAAVFYGLYLLVAGRVRATLDTRTTMALATTAGAVVMLAGALVLGQPLGGFSPQSWLALLGLGFVSQLGGVLAINYALGHFRATVVSVTLLLQPVLVALLAALLLGEALSWEMVLGGAFVLGGIYLVHRRGR